VVLVLVTQAPLAEMRVEEAGSSSAFYLALVVLVLALGKMEVVAGADSLRL